MTNKKGGGGARCNERGCDAIPSFGTEGQGRREYCAQHAKDGMRYRGRTKCRVDSCSFSACCGKPGLGNKPMYCARHAMKGMVRLDAKGCIHPGCLLEASYGVKGGKKRAFCSQHAISQKADVIPRIEPRRKMCLVPGCIILPSYGHEGTGKREYCRSHAQRGMTYRGKSTCMEPGCFSSIPCRTGSNKKMVYCAQHERSGARESDGRTTTPARSGSSSEVSSSLLTSGRDSSKADEVGERGSMDVEVLGQRATSTPSSPGRHQSPSSSATIPLDGDAQRASRGIHHRISSISSSSSSSSEVQNVGYVGIRDAPAADGNRMELSSSVTTRPATPGATTHVTGSSGGREHHVLHSGNEHSVGDTNDLIYSLPDPRAISFARNGEAFGRQSAGSRDLRKENSSFTTFRPERRGVEAERSRQGVLPMHSGAIRNEDVPDVRPTDSISPSWGKSADIAAAPAWLCGMSSTRAETAAPPSFRIHQGEAPHLLLTRHGWVNWDWKSALVNPTV